jgi:hypothetical protein
MRIILCIIAVLVLSISAVSQARGCEATPVVPADPVTLPNVDPQLLDAAMKNLATAIATNNFDEIGRSLAIAEEQLATAIHAGGIGDVKAKVKHTSDGLYRVDIKINGRFTEQQEAYIFALLQKYEGQLPGIDVNLKIC